MDWTWSFPVWSLIIFSPTLLLLLLLHRHKSSSNRLPPGPPGWPVFGHLFSLGAMPHRTLAGLKKQYGHVIWLNLGSINTMVVLSAKAATELFKSHDLSFVDRTTKCTMQSHGYDKASLALAPYGTYWRVLKRLCTVEMLVSKRINETVSIRRKCVDDMLLWIEKEAHVVAEARGGVHVARFVFLTSFNLLGNLMLSRDLVDPQSKVGSEFLSVITTLMQWSGHPNISDLFPWLRCLDLQGLRRKMDRDLGNALKIASGFVKERMKERQEGTERKKDFLDVLLEFDGSGKDELSKLSDHQINTFILEIFLAGSETTSSTTEWAMTELLCNPKSMSKVKDELAKVVGPNRKFEESDIENLPYLQAVVKETLRLHPPIPFLVPRKAIEDTDFMGYHIPKNTQVFVNVWAIGRDEECWDDPFSFKPERFLGSKVEYKGQHHEFIPFGSGRRMCAGVPLAHRMLHLVLGSLLHEFDWELDGHVTPETMDMKDRLGVTVRKLEPLKAVPRKGKVE
ncbi:cytochrome P450 76A2-like [Cornus florida]|uniref:cytochrome P450 76A2-like n=1 Tax=Cornus florida TaxID=4283 RepID=UPI00289AE9F5|nr:cytochrome P450 76A2-like [Cornus florida]